MSLVRPIRPPIRPDLWIEADFTTWTHNDVSTDYTLTIYDNHELTRPHDLTGEELWIVISNDYPPKNQWDTETKFVITNAKRGKVSIRMPVDAVSRIGEFKVEAYIFDGINRRFAHHIDFNVVP